MDYKTVENLRKRIKVEEVFEKVLGEDTPITKKMKLKDRCYDDVFIGKSFRYEIETFSPYSNIDNNIGRFQLIFEIFQSENELRVYFVPTGIVGPKNTSGQIEGLYLLLCVKEEDSGLFYDNSFIDQSNSWSSMTFSKYTGSGYINRWLVDTIRAFKDKYYLGYGIYDGCDDMYDELKIRDVIKKVFGENLRVVVKPKGESAEIFLVTENTAGYIKNGTKAISSPDSFENPLFIKFYLFYNWRDGYIELTNAWFRVFEERNIAFWRESEYVTVKWITESFQFYGPKDLCGNDINTAIITKMKKWVKKHEIDKYVKFQKR